jgi:hypothetical protein
MTTSEQHDNRRQPGASAQPKSGTLRGTQPQRSLKANRAMGAGPVSVQNLRQSGNDRERPASVRTAPGRRRSRPPTSLREAIAGLRVRPAAELRLPLLGRQVPAETRARFVDQIGVAPQPGVHALVVAHCGESAAVVRERHQRNAAIVDEARNFAPGLRIPDPSRPVVLAVARYFESGPKMTSTMPFASSVGPASWTSCARGCAAPTS